MNTDQKTEMNDNFCNAESCKTTDKNNDALKKCTDDLRVVTAEYENFKRHFEADFANFKRRVEKERAEWHTAAQATTLTKILPFIDDLDRALTVSYENTTLNENHDFKVWLAGFELISKNIHKTLESLGVTEIDCSGTFNPEFHEAMNQVVSEEHASGNIVHVLRRGYLFKGQVLCHARVSVAQ